jgi:hypothetical protein
MFDHLFWRHICLTSMHHQAMLVPGCAASVVLYPLLCHLQLEVLDVLQAEVEEAAQVRAAKSARSSNARRQSTSGGGAAPAAASLLSPIKGAAPQERSRSDGGAGRVAWPPVGRPRSTTGEHYAGWASPTARRLDGPATPMPLRGVSSRSLSERHSICVVR